MTKSAASTVAALGLLAASPAAHDLSKYRNFQLGAELATVTKEAGADPAQVTVIHNKPRFKI